MKIVFEADTVHAVADQMVRFLRDINRSLPAVEPTKPEPISIAPPEPASDVPSSATDLMAAVMPMVAGDKAKKDTLVAILAEFNAKTINKLAPEHYEAFWKAIKEQL